MSSIPAPSPRHPSVGSPPFDMEQQRKPAGNESFPKEYRLLKRWEFERVYGQGKKLVQRDVILYVLAVPGQNSQAGISVGKALGPAVIRNRLRRRIREILRRSLGHWLPGHQVVVVARNPAKDLEYRQLKATIEGLLIRSGVMKVAD